MYLSFVIPCYRSEYTIKAVVDEIIAVVDQRKEYPYEIILVNDCSPDGVFQVQAELARANNQIKVVSLSKNSGKAAAVLAGMAKMSGDVCVLLDDDGQCPVEHLWDLVSRIEDGYDMAIADYPKKKENLIKRIGSRVNNLLMRFLLDQPSGIRFSNFNIRRRYVCDQMVRYRNPYPNLQMLALGATHNIVMVPMEERERVNGKGGYTFFKSLKLLLNGCTGFSVRPLRIAIVLGMLFSLAGFGMALFTIVQKLIHPAILMGYSSIIASIFLVGGVIMALLGVIGEYIGRIYVCINDSPQYVIRDEIGFAEGGSDGKGD